MWNMVYLIMSSCQIVLCQKDLTSSPMSSTCKDEKIIKIMGNKFKMVNITSISSWEMINLKTCILIEFMQKNLPFLTNKNFNWKFFFSLKNEGHIFNDLSLLCGSYWRFLRKINITFPIHGTAWPCVWFIFSGCEIKVAGFSYG